MNERKIKYAGFYLLGIVMAFIANYFILLCFILPNAYHYNTGDSNSVIELLYDFPSSNGYEPEPSMLNMALTFIVGTLIGFFTFRLINSCKVSKTL